MLATLMRDAPAVLDPIGEARSSPITNSFFSLATADKKCFFAASFS
jgi:hypothetical protein